MPTTNNQENEAIVCFQDMMESYHNNIDIEISPEESDDVANIFFELANAPLVSYRLLGSKSKGAGNEIVIQQDVAACGQHTGGIVWETAYLLLNFLRSQQLSCKSFLEVGAGCGLVGLGVHMAPDISISDSVIMTETPLVMKNLRDNLERNYYCGNKCGNNNDSKRCSKNENKCSLRACTLDWTCCEKDCLVGKIDPHSIDTIVGTDVVFSTQLVEPLLQTLRYLAHDATVIYLCLQERCKDSHQLLFQKATDHEFLVQDISAQVASTQECEWGKDLECCLLQLTVIPESKRNSSTKKKRKRKKENDNKKAMK